MVIGLAQQTLQAQTLGGIPDPTFNVGDSGLAAVQLNLSNQLFYPGPHGGVFVSAYQKFKQGQTTKNQVVFRNEYHY